MGGHAIVAVPLTPPSSPDGGAGARRPGAPMPAHPDLPAEQAYLEQAYRHLARMRSRTASAAALAESAAQAVDSAIAQAHLGLGGDFEYGSGFEHGHRRRDQ